MADAAIQATIEDDFETELSRLGSSKALYALTEGEMETAAVLAGLADRMATAAGTFDGWAGGEATEQFRAAGEMAREHAERIEAAGDSTESVDRTTPVDEVLRDLEDPDARLGGLLAWLLVTDRTLAQAVGFFVGNADPGAADLFRGLREDVDDRREAVLDRLESADGAAAGAAARDVVQAAYDHYVETLEGMGVKVKPVC